MNEERKEMAWQRRDEWKLDEKQRSKKKMIREKEKYDDWREEKVRK